MAHGPRYSTRSELFEEVKKLMHGSGVRRENLREAIGSELRQIWSINSGMSPEDVERIVAKELETLIATLEPRKQVYLCIGFNLDRPWLPSEFKRSEFMQRVSWFEGNAKNEAYSEEVRAYRASNKTVRSHIDGAIERDVVPALLGRSTSPVMPMQAEDERLSPPELPFKSILPYIRWGAYQWRRAQRRALSAAHAVRDNLDDELLILLAFLGLIVLAIILLVVANRRANTPYPHDPDGVIIGSQPLQTREDVYTTAPAGPILQPGNSNVLVFCTDRSVEDGVPRLWYGLIVIDSWDTFNWRVPKKLLFIPQGELDGDSSSTYPPSEDKGLPPCLDVLVKWESPTWLPGIPWHIY